MLTPTPVGVHISEDVPVLGEVLKAKGIRVPKDIRVPEHFPKKIEITRPFPTRKNVLPAHPYILQLLIVFIESQEYL